MGVVALKDARIKAHEIEIIIHEGKSPKNTSLNSDPTLKSIYFEFVSSDKFTEMKSRYNLKKVFKKYTIPQLGRFKFSQITIRECKEHWKWVKQNADGKNKENTARLCISYLSTVLKWADKNLPNLELDINPTQFDKDYTPKKRSRVLSEYELKSLLVELSNQDRGLIIPFYQFYMCVLLTGIRNGELRQMRWSEIERGILVRGRNGEVSATVNIWNCPPVSTKDSRPIRFVLFNEVMSIIDTINSSKRGLNDGYVFHGKGGRNKPMAPPKSQTNNIRCKLDFAEPWTLHDLRRTMITWLSENGESAADIDRLIGKVVNEGAASHRIYDHAQKLDISAAIAKRWADYIKELKD